MARPTNDTVPIVSAHVRSLLVVQLSSCFYFRHRQPPITTALGI